MEQIMKLPVDTGKAVLSEDYKSILRNLFSGCRVNFFAWCWLFCKSVGDT